MDLMSKSEHRAGGKLILGLKSHIRSWIKSPNFNFFELPNNPTNYKTWVGIVHRMCYCIACKKHTETLYEMKDPPFNFLFQKECWLTLRLDNDAAHWHLPVWQIWLRWTCASQALLGRTIPVSACCWKNLFKPKLKSLHSSQKILNSFTALIQRCGSNVLI